MDAIAYSNARKMLAKLMARVCDNHETLIITRKNSDSVVMMSLKDFNSIQETAYLLRTPANAERLRRSIQQYKDGRVKPRKLQEA